MKRIIRLTESDLHNIIRRVISEAQDEMPMSVNQRLQAAMGDDWKDEYKKLSLRQKKKLIKQRTTTEDERIAKELEEWQRFRRKLVNGKLGHLFVFGCGPNCGFRRDIEDVIKSTAGQFKHVDEDVEALLRKTAEKTLEQRRKMNPNKNTVRDESPYRAFMRDFDDMMQFGNR